MELRTVEIHDGLYINKDDLLDFLMAYSEIGELDLPEIFIIRELYDVLNASTHLPPEDDNLFCGFMDDE